MRPDMIPTQSNDSIGSWDVHALLRIACEQDETGVDAQVDPEERVVYSEGKFFGNEGLVATTDRFQGAGERGTVRRQLHGVT